MFDYEYIKTIPSQGFAQIKYTKEGEEDFYTNILGINEFSEQRLAQVAQLNAERAQKFWEQSKNTETPIDASPVIGKVKEVIYLPEPKIDHDTQVIAPTITETDDQIIYGFKVRSLVIKEVQKYDPFNEKIEFQEIETDEESIRGYVTVELTEEEKLEFLTGWRLFSSITPRQARLELAKRGQLSNIDQIIASLPADQQEVVQIEWEYAVSIERSSPWVIQLGSALGLDEEGLDELFKAAAGL